MLISTSGILQVPLKDAIPVPVKGDGSDMPASSQHAANLLLIRQIQKILK